MSTQTELFDAAMDLSNEELSELCKRLNAAAEERAFLAAVDRPLLPPGRARRRCPRADTSPPQPS